VTLRAHVENKTHDGVPMTLARIGLPGGTVFQTWQLKELRDKGLVDFYETRPREVVLYWRALPPNAVKDVELDLLASVPGTYEAPATSAYLYYTAEDKAWAPPVQVTVTR
jgi:A-macroglobulin receptor